MHRNRAISQHARAGFTLMELMVSVAILLAVLALIGTIFSTTSKAGGQATAITSVHRQLRQAAEIIRQDLEAMDPRTDVLGAAGVVVPARDSRKAATYSSHRADVLMLITNRRDTRPSAFTAYTDPNTDLGEKMQVVYGHADTAMFGSTWPPVPVTTLKRIENTPSSDIPAYDWHLARRTILFPTTALAATINAATDGVEGGALIGQEFLLGNSDLTLLPLVADYFPSGVFTYYTGNLVECYLNLFTSTDTAHPCSYQYRAARGGSPWRLYDTVEKRWYLPATGSQWKRTEDPSITKTVNALPGPPLLTNYQLDQQFYSGLPSGWTYRRTVIDSTPLLNDSRRVGLQFLPNCSDFRVEFSYDDPRDVDEDHWGGGLGDPLNGTLDPIARPIHWRSLDNQTQWVWSKISAHPTDRTQTDRWPSAIRITLRAWDAGGRLEEPVTYTLIHSWASGN